MADPLQQTIGVKYSCVLCGIHRREVKVPVRENVREDGSDVIDWIKGKMEPALVADHRRQSPDCRSGEFAEVMIPITGRDAVGGPTKN